MSSGPADHVVRDYRPSQPTGWEFGKTIGGHHSSREFELAGRRVRIALLAFGQPAGSPNGVYESVPADPAIAFSRALQRKFGPYYSFRYAGGLRGRDEFRVQCCSVFAEPRRIGLGAQLYLPPDRGMSGSDPRRLLHRRADSAA
jgi:hypothetical protein